VDGHPDLSGSLFIGCDAAVRKDNAAIVCVKYADESDQLVLADYKIWKPLPGQPINLESKRRVLFKACLQQSKRPH